MKEHSYSLCRHIEDTHMNTLVLTCFIKSHTLNLPEAFSKFSVTADSTSLYFLTNPENVTVWSGSTIFTLPFSGILQILQIHCEWIKMHPAIDLVSVILYQ